MNRQLKKSLLNWKIQVGSGKGELTVLTPEDAVSFRKEDLAAEWCMADGMKIMVRWQLEGEGATGEISFEQIPENKFVEIIHFPVLLIPFEDPRGLFFPVSAGLLADGEVFTQRTKPYVSTFGSMQYTAVFNGDTGFYAACRDPEHFFKKYQARPLDEGKTVELEFIHYLPLSGEFSPSGKLPYELEVRSFQGGWFEAAQIYRRWAEKQEWFINARSKKQPMRETALLVWNRCDGDDVIPPAEQIKAELNAPVALNWWWWQNKPNCTDYPLFWPPRDGEKEYAVKMKKLKAQKIRTTVYLNGTNWDLHGVWGEEGKSCGVMLRDGSYQHHWYGTFNKRPLGDICGERNKFHDELIRQIEKHAASGVQGIYLDVFGNLAFDCCYNPLHTHVPGGGAYYAQGYRAFIAELRERFPGISFSTEYASECFIDLLDSMVVLCHDLYGFWSVKDHCVPAFNAVYHGCCPLLGTYQTLDGRMPVDRRFWPADFPGIWKEEQEKDWCKLFPEQFFYNIARMVVEGYIPSIHNLTSEQCSASRCAQEYAYLKKAALFYYENREFLYDGEMLSPEGFVCKTITFKYFIRFVLMPPEQCGEAEITAPALLHCIWRSPAGKKALFVANYTKHEQSFKYRNMERRISPLELIKILLPE